MRVLEDTGLFENTDGIYELTDLGREFLAGDHEEDLPEP